MYFAGEFSPYSDEFFLTTFGLVAYGSVFIVLFFVSMRKKKRVDRYLHGFITSPFWGVVVLAILLHWIFSRLVLGDDPEDKPKGDKDVE